MNEKSWPKISIVTPAFNARQFIEAAIKSVLEQNYPNLEYIIIDGGSTDGTVDIIKKYEKHISHWESNPDRGQTHALNKGFSRATGILRGWLNADEEYLPGTLRCVGGEYSASNDLELIYGNRYFLNLNVDPPVKRLEKIFPILPFSLMFYTGRILCSDATFWTKQVHDALGELDEERYPRYAMDAEWLLRVTGMVHRWKHIAKPLSVFKLHGVNITTEAVNRGLRYNEQIRRAYAKAHGISTFKIFLGWLWYSTRLRIWEKGILGMFTPPRWDTFAYLFLHKYRKNKQKNGFTKKA
ncbi:MAG: glycosyltransferase family 2 protein [Candidatus Aceula meridiana]|nr:glycosyltransferase family 2 protein [Candidatus Aceula meridiana]